jgi:hypothetical protein
MKKILLLLFFPVSIVVEAQLLNSEELYDKVVLLKEKFVTGERYGTGFLITSNNSFFLITAKHVADSLHIEFAEIYFRDSSKKPISYRIKRFIPSQPVVQFNEQSDFFILRLYPFDSTSAKILRKASLELKNIANNRESLDRKFEVFVFGYPIFDFDNFTPITFKSHISSSLMNIYVKNLPKPCFCYLLENPSMSGFSGGPVFVGVKDRATMQMNATLIIGIVTGTTYDKTGGKFAIITPTFHLLDLINK